MEATREYLTADALGDFRGAGTQMLLEAVQTPDLPQHEANDIASLVFTEVLMALQAGKLDTDSVTEFLKLAITDDNKAAVFCLVYDVFPLNDVLKMLLVQIYQDQAVITASSLAQYVDSETLVAAGIVPGDSLNRQLNTRKRDEYFTQKKFNLLHEEFEGFTKLINEFQHILQNRNRDRDVKHAVHVVELLMGHYLLDPNRVLDVLFDVCSNYIVGNHRFIMNFFRATLWWPANEATINDLEGLHVGGCLAAAKLVALRLLKQPADREVSETFKLMVAIFMKEGFISFGSLYTYLSPLEEAMSKLESQYKKELEDKVFKASASALALAAPLADDEEEDGSTRAASAKTEAKVSVKSLLAHNMKVQMLKVFLGNGMYWPSIYILSQYPFLVFCDPEIPELMHRLLAVLLQPLHSKISPFSPETLAAFQKERPIALSRPMNKVKYETPETSLLYCFKPTAKAFSNKKLVYFYTEWTDMLPLVESAADLLKVSEQFVKFFTVELASSASNFIKICEIIAADLENDSLAENLETWFNYFRNYILPVLGSIEENPIPVDKAYAILSFYRPEDRYNLYGELYQVIAKNNPHVKLTYGRAEKATKDVLKRLSKENVKPMMRRLAKISFSNPLPCFLTILQQIESYDNLNALVVETASYFNDYGWDNLTLAILMRITASGRSSLQENGLNERQWIQSLASFIGQICQKYPKNIDLSSLLLFLLKSFHTDDGSGLIILKEILSAMGGIQAITNLTQLQINMINCGSSLEKVVYQTIGDLRYECSQSGTVLCQKLFEDDHVNEYLVLLCKYNNGLVSGSQHSHLKALANKKDEVDAVLHLLCTLIGFFADAEMAAALLPVNDLVNDYNVPIVWAFEFWRGFLADVNADKFQEGIAKFFPSSSSQLPIRCYSTFWGLNLYDINYTPELYDEELEKMEARITRLKEEVAFARRDKEVSEAKVQQMRTELEKAKDFVKHIPDQKLKHQKHNETMTTKLLAEASSWFQDTEEKTGAKELLQLCVLPRAIHSSFDALFCSSFLFKLLSIKTPYYSLISVLRELFESNILFGTLFTCSPTEAENLGLFVSAVLNNLSSLANQELVKETFGDAVTFTEFRQIVYDIHSLILSDISRALTVKDYMSRMNAITFLKNLLGSYPVVEDHCEQMIKLMEHIANHEKRDDLKLSSSALIGHVKSRAKSWIHIWDFIEMDEDTKSELQAKRKAVEDERARILAEEKQKKARLAQEAEKLRQRELQEKIEKEKAEQHAANAISYDDAAPAQARSGARGDEAPKSRYDYYSKFEASSGEKEQDSKRKVGKETVAKGSSESAPTASKDFKKETSKDMTSTRDGSKHAPAAKKDFRDQKKDTPAAPLAQKAALPNAAKKHEFKKGPSPDPRTASSGFSGSRPHSSAPSRLATPVGQKPTGPNGRAPPVGRNAAPAKTTAPPKQPARTEPSDDLFKLKIGRDTKPDLKSRLQEVKNEYRANQQKRTEQQTKPSPTGSPALGPRALTPGGPLNAPLPPPSNPPNAARKAPLPPPAEPPRRAPLPPQQAPRDSRSGFGRNEYDRGSSGRYNATNDRKPSGRAPLPPPSLPPPRKQPAREDTNGNGARYKRKYDGPGREYDKRQR